VPDQAVLDVRGVVMRRDGRQVLGPLDWTVRRGEHWAVLGPNGAGKTTLVTIIAAREFPSGGDVAILGARLGQVDVRVLRRRIGHLSHVVAEMIRPETTVADVVVTAKTAALVTWWDRFDDNDRARAAELLDLVGCADLARQRFSHCSHGERQRVLLARALMSEPDLLLLDEPTGGLDLAGREQFLRGVETTVRDGRIATSVIVTHHLEELPATTTHALLLRAGHVVAAGPAAEVVASEPLSTCFDVRIDVERRDGRWAARAAALPSDGPAGNDARYRAGGWTLH